MRIWHLAVLFVLGVIVFALANLPLAAALSWAGASDARLSYARAEGTVWNGRLEEAVFGPVALGDVDLTLRPLDLLFARFTVKTRFSGADLSGEGLVSGDLSGTVRLSDARLAGDLGALPLDRFLPKPKPPPCARSAWIR